MATGKQHIRGYLPMFERIDNIPFNQQRGYSRVEPEWSNAALVRSYAQTVGQKVMVSI